MIHLEETSAMRKEEKKERRCKSKAKEGVVQTDVERGRKGAELGIFKEG